MSEIKYSDVKVKLVGKDGNAFVIIGNVTKAIRDNVGNEEAKDFADEAMNCDSYDELMALCMRTVTTY
jgi:hypothetical protein